MVENAYKRSNSEIKTGAVQYSVQPNLSASRGFEKLESAMKQGMQLKQQINEADFQKRQTDFRNTISVFQENYEKASWKERQMMAKELENIDTGSTGKDNKWDRELERMGIEFSSKVNINLEREREQRRKAAAAAAKAAAKKQDALKGKIEQLRLLQSITDAQDVEEQRGLLDSYKKEFVTPYAEATDVEGMTDYVNGLSTYNTLNSKISTAEENAVRAQQKVDTNVAFVNLTRAMNATTDIEEQRRLSNAYWDEQVQPLVGSTDPFEMELLATAMDRFSRVEAGVIQRRREIADNALFEEAITASISVLMANGGITPEEFVENRERFIAERSDYPENRGQLNQAYANAVLNSVMAQFNRPDFVPTKEDVALINTQLKDLAEADSYMRGSPKYIEAQNFASGMKRMYDNKLIADVGAALQNSGVSVNAFKEMSENLLDQNIISEQMHNKNVTQKKEAVREVTHRQQIMSLIADSDPAGINKLLNDDTSLKLSTVQSTVKESLELKFSTLSKLNPDEQGKVNASILKEYAKYQEYGVAPKSLPSIDQALQRPRSGEAMSDKEVLDFRQTYEAMQESGYFFGNSTARNNAAADYLAIKGMEEFGVLDIGPTLNNARQNRIHVTGDKIDKTLMDAMGATPSWLFENLNPQNTRFIMNALRPVARAMMEGGYDPSRVEEFVEISLETDWFRTDPKIGGSSEVWIPKSENVPTEKSYKRTFDAINQGLKDNNKAGLDYLAPLNPQDPDGDWIAFRTDNVSYTLPNEVIGTIARTGRVPKK